MRSPSYRVKDGRDIPKPPRSATSKRRQGESRGGDVRILFRPPVAVFFEIDEDRNLVRILRTWLY